MTLSDLLKKYDLSDSFLLGFYGGGNYGDELLLEVLQNLLHQHGRTNISFLYQHPDELTTHHHKFNYQPVHSGSKLEVIKTLFMKRTIVVGGGGLWGMDINANVFLMSVMLFIGRFLLGKQVILIGVGYYNSTSRLGHLGAWCAAKAANLILARDQETFDNFDRLNDQTYLGQDIAWSLPDLDLSDYKQDLATLEKQLPIKNKTVLITLRHFKSGFKQSFDQTIQTIIQDNPKRHIVVGILEPKSVDPIHWQKLQRWQRDFPNVRIIDFSFNPIALYLFFIRHHQQLIYIGPQFHAILTAHLSGVPYMPISYDNKVQSLLVSLGFHDSLPIQDIRPHHVQQFIAKYSREL
jgi:polysaccharide pyruvyl transferase WcaK-like protein